MTTETSQYYINKRIDSLELNLKEQINNRFDALEKKIDTQLINCISTKQKFNERVTSLENYRNRAVGAIAIIVFLLSIWKVTG